MEIKFVNQGKLDKQTTNEVMSEVERHSQWLVSVLDNFTKHIDTWVINILEWVQRGVIREVNKCFKLIKE